MFRSQAFRAEPFFSVTKKGVLYAIHKGAYVELWMHARAIELLIGRYTTEAARRLITRRSKDACLSSSQREIRF